LLQPDDRAEENDVEESSPLAKYAAEHWVTHGQFQSVSSLLRKPMEYLFDSDKPYFTAWLQLYDIDEYVWSRPSSLYWFATRTTSGATPLYYAALFGFQDLVEHLIMKHPHHVDARGGFFETPLLAALARRHFQTAELLRNNGADVNVRYRDGTTPLHATAWYGDFEMVRVLLNYKADVNAQDSRGWTPIHSASQESSHSGIPNVYQSLPDVIRLLLGHGADVNARLFDGRTPLHVAMRNPVEVVRVLLEHGANVDAEDSKGRTPFQIAWANGYEETMKLLSEHGAKGKGQW
jgi:ankyrin repeat protein